ncbi:hypothetical protein PLESTB_001437500 [Pleodorina starrii]|uniref:RRM domain-containing protein n=1 Tax=Pleodorina starrii TaxID=330485 RepID=A0A9W6BWB9_9CHLO|nr:hypothetical protein PLESTM_002011600 [Pleodorina starrii]GLC59045.1 hypothetical protein PLESTB_001437500 [Pleodorina starrii]GLC77114.1 hypothetical protein PLESTF_001886100 [Pleodorina starrii]
MMFGNAGTNVSSFSTEQPLGVYPVFSPALAGGPAPTLSSTGEEIRTIFVTGFPPNVHDRELHNLVCFLPGYEASQMNTKPATGTAPQGFALFSSHAHAQAAMLMLHDMQFDTDCHLRCEIAHKNMYLKDDPSIRRADVRRMNAAASLVPGGAAAGTVLAAMSPSGMGPITLTPGGPQFAAAGMGPQAFTSPLLASTLASLRPAAGHHHHSSTLLPAPGHAVAMAAQQAGLIGGAPAVSFGPVTNKFDNPPCNTLFIGNLGDTVDENELTQLFGNQPGYKQLKLLRHPRQVSCFVEFVDMASASAVHSRLQGCILHTSDRGPIRIQYSKNPYGKRSPHAGGGGGPSAAAIASSMASAAGTYGTAGHSLPSSSPSSSAALLGAAAAAAAVAGGANMVPSSMANAIMAVSAGGDFASWPQHFTLG